MTRQEELQMLRSVRGLYAYKVRGPAILLLLGAGFCAFVIGSFLLLGLAGAVTRLLTW
jgi:hypothetical protein